MAIEATLCQVGRDTDSRFKRSNRELSLLPEISVSTVRLPFVVGRKRIGKAVDSLMTSCAGLGVNKSRVSLATL